MIFQATAQTRLPVSANGFKHMLLHELSKTKLSGSRGRGKMIITKTT